MHNFRAVWILEETLCKQSHKMQILAGSQMQQDGLERTLATQTSLLILRCPFAATSPAPNNKPAS